MGLRDSRAGAGQPPGARAPSMTFGIASILLAAGTAFAAPAPRPHPLPRRPLATLWPARTDCRAFSSVDVSVDDRVDAVEWRGPEGRSIVVPVKAPSGPDPARERFRKGSGALDYFGVWQASQILFPNLPRPFIGMRAARGSQLLSHDFKPGVLDALVMRPRPDAERTQPSTDADNDAGFGLRVALHCSDPSKTGLEWVCDDRSCGLRSFRDDPSTEQGRKWIDGPYRRRWRNGERADDRARLACGRSDGYEQASRRARRHNWNVVCERATPLTDQRPALIDMTRDLLAELDLVIDQGCIGSCSSRVDELYAKVRGLAAAPLRLLGARARFDPEDDVLDRPAALGWVARIGGGPDQVELACDEHEVENSAGVPATSCRLTVIGRSKRLADYFPDNRQEVEFPDGGAVHLQGSIVESEDSYQDTFGRHIVIVGSALAMADDPMPLAKLDGLQVELDVRRQGSFYARMFTKAYDNGTSLAWRCVLPAAKARATFNGQPLERLTGIYAGGDLQYNRDCLLELAFPGPTVHEVSGGGHGGPTPTSQGMKMGGPISARARSPGPATVRIDEGGTHVALEIPDAFTPRGLTFVSPADGVLHAGERVTIRWQPATDDISQAAIALRPAGSQRIEEQVTIQNKDLTIQGDRIELTIPKALPDNLHGDIEILFLGTAFVKPRFGPCPVDKCTVDLIFDVPPLKAELR